MLLHTLHILLKFYTICHQNFMTDLSSSLEHFDLLPFWIAHFEVHILGNKITILLFSKNFPNLLNDPWTYSFLTNPKISAPDLFDKRSFFFLLRSEFMSWSTLKNCGFAVRNLVSSRSQSGYKGFNFPVCRLGYSIRFFQVNLIFTNLHHRFQ